MFASLTNFASGLLDRTPLDHAALRSDDTIVSYGELIGRVAQRQQEFGLDQRSVVLLTGDTSIDWVVSYLALIEAGHVPLLAGDHTAELVAAWRPAAIITADAEGDRLVIERSSHPALDLHPDLALLLSTSGSTGNPKLVRLSHDNLASNARSIASFLDLRSSDRGITALPLHYCYGLSVLHSHLEVGASVVLTSASVVDPCFSEAMRRHAVTNVAGVPHTFDLLEQAGADRLHTPSLRFLTQAGGKMAPDAVRRWVDRTESWGTDFFVMYGQTEATARMAYLPPDVARRRPEAIGIAVPNGELHLDTSAAADAGSGVGELVYRGPNVMLGYATTAADLGLGRTVHELRTGDLARFHADDGVFEIVGRRARFVKPFGLRIDLDALELRLSSEPFAHDVAIGGDDDGIVICAPGADEALVRSWGTERTGLPASRLSIDVESPIPRTPSGKVDYGSITQSRPEPGTAPAETALADPTSVPTADATDAVRATFARVLGRPDVDGDDTFVSLGGDSLSYIECSIQLESILGRLPADWHLCPIDALQTRHRGRFLTRIDTTVLLRVIGICAVVATHMHLRFVPGGAHLMLAVVGYNLSRFMLPIADTRARILAGLRTVARVAVPTVVWVAGGLLLGASYGAGTLLLVNNYVGPRSHRQDHWHFWFIEVFIQATLALTILLAIRPVRNLERRLPYLFPLGLLGLALLARMEWAQMGDWYNLRYRTHGVAWFLVLGWLMHRSDTLPKRATTAAICLLTVPGFFHYAPREWFITVGLLVLLFWREVPFPRLAVRPVAALASASMWIYISHFAIWPPMVDLLGVRLAYVATIGAGVGIWALSERVVDLARSTTTWRRVATRYGVVRIP
ncbi:MAG: AMP-binding protein [Ilumatobacteraceae bacterium]